MKQASLETIDLGPRRVDYRLVNSKTARKVRVRVGPNGIEVVKPAARHTQEVTNFIHANQRWILDQLSRIERLGSIRHRKYRDKAAIPFRGRPTRVRIETIAGLRRENRVFIRDGEIVIQRGPRSRIPASQSFENWLRKQAREEIHRILLSITQKLRRSPHRVYIMGQRTKWGNCSSKKNLSFNWRLILAPSQVLQYLVAHEAVHLAVLDHSARFWLTLRSLCSNVEQSRHWLAQNGDSLFGFSPSQFDGV
jgi:Predicted metal-dependent hydrolase